ncbi:MAG: hypothetical protein IT318_17315 [Anaerolineales bacterium]|nr:hypothetical protein [Anaerolineales bacterium]
MKNIDATLLASQKIPAGRPIARASLADNGRLHPAAGLKPGVYTGGVTHACACGDFYLRLRWTGGGANTLDVQKITDPTVETQWETWTAGFASDVRDGYAVGVFWTGTYVVAVWQDASDNDTYYRRSADGSSWSSAAVAHNFIGPTYEATLGGVSGGLINSGIVLAYNNKLYWGHYSPAGDSWSTLEDAGISIDTDQAPEVAGFYDSGNSRHVFFCNPVGYYDWARFVILVLARTGASTFTTPRPYHYANRFNFKYLSVSQETINGFWWLSFSRARGWSDDVFWLAPSDDGLFFEDCTPTGVLAEPLLAVLPALAGYDVCLANENVVETSAAHSFWSNATVVRYTLDHGGELTVLVDNRAGALATPQLNAELTLERGYQIEGVDYYQSAGIFYVTGFRFLARDQLLELTAVDARGLLGSWLADQAFTQRGQTVETLAEIVCALAGVHAASFDAHSLWSGTVATYSVFGNTSGLAALRSLQRLAPFDFTVQEDGSIDFYIPDVGPASQYTYGPGEHEIWPGEFGGQVHSNYTAVIGDPPHDAASEYYDVSAVAAAGRRWSEVVSDPRVGSEAAALVVATQTQVRHIERRRRGSFEAPPNLGLEVNDVLTIADGAYAAAVGKWRVDSFAEFFNTQRRRPFYQQVRVRGVV